MTKYKPDNRKALLFVFSWLVTICCGVLLSASVLWGLGQFVLGIAFFQAFILLHETGHYSFFEKKKANTFFGYFFGGIALIPFSSWVDIHNQHHKWTGWRDKDPTTTGTVNPKHSLLTRMLVNACWFLYLPLFTIGYRIGNYWNMAKIKRFSPKTNPKRVLLDLGTILVIWILAISLFLEYFLHYVLLSYLIGLMISDLIILSQHSHIDIPVSNGDAVKPIKYKDQVQYTRSIRFGKFLEHWILFNFNWHKKHHEFPGLPAYFLQKEKTTMDAKNFWTYVYHAKSLTGEQFVFSTSKETGREV